MKQARDVLDRLLQKMGIQFGRYPSFYRQWPALAGEKIAAESRIKDIVNKTLIIEVFHPGTKQLIQLNSEKILKEVAKYYPEFEIIALKSVLASRKKHDKEEEPANRDQEIIEKGISQQSENMEESGNLDEVLQKLKKAVEEESVIDRNEE
jgi:hypothetical protein